MVPANPRPVPAKDAWPDALVATVMVPIRLTPAGDPVIVAVTFIPACGTGLPAPSRSWRIGCWAKATPLWAATEGCWLNAT